MNRAFLKCLRREASQPFWTSGLFAYFSAHGKLGGDPIFAELLSRDLLPAQGRLLDLGCGQASLFAWLLAARRLFEQGQWPAEWAIAPDFQSLRGIELMAVDVRRAQCCFAEQPQVQVEQGDMVQADFGRVNVVTVLDALHYLAPAQQTQVLARIHSALLPGGLFLTRVGDASAGLPFRISTWVDRLVFFARGQRRPHLHCRSLADWTTLLRGLGFEVETNSMPPGQGHANVMLVCRLPLSDLMRSTTGEI